MLGLCSLQVSPPGPWIGCVCPGILPASPAGRAGARAAPSASVELPAAVGDRDGALRGQAGDWAWPATAEMSWGVSAWLLHARRVRQEGCAQRGFPHSPEHTQLHIEAPEWH